MLLANEEKLELLHIIKNHHGYDFEGYADASMHRRITRYCERNNINNFYDLKSTIVNSSNSFASFLLDITVNVTEMYREPAFFKSLTQHVFPYLDTFPFFKVWHAGCSTGEEVYSLAILLNEANLLRNARIYATDINQQVLKTAREGIYPLKEFRQYAKAYADAGGQQSLTDYFTTRYGMAAIDDKLKTNLVFATHNLAGEGSFNEFQLILCRNVLIYFKRDLQNRVLQLLYESMPVYGFLALGSRETIRFSPVYRHFEVVDNQERIYRKIS